MAGCGYHSPQFSEDAAWLPAWLQPHQLPAFGDRTKDEQNMSPLACKDSAYFRGTACGGQDGQLFTSGDARYSGCRLFLSGDDTSPTGNTPSDNAVLLHLHLSSSVSGGSQSSSDPLNGNNQTRKCEPSKALSTRLISEALLASNGTDHQSKMEDEKHSSDMHLVVLEQRESHKSSPVPLVNIDLVNRQGFQAKLDPGELQNADVNNAVELSISASEALVISEILSSSSQSESLPMGPTILEIALRVRQARTQDHLDIPDVDSVLSTDALDETDQLFLLDEAIMADTFDDVGLCVTQVVANPGNNLEYEEKTKGKKIRTPDVDTKGIIYQSRDTSPVDVDFKGDVDTLKHGLVAKQVDAGITNAIKKYFIEETSFISESTDLARQQTVEQRAEGLEIIASSNLPLRKLSRCTILGSKSSTSETLVLSEDPENFSSLSLEDLLCSVVPCSIASENPPFELNEDVRSGRKIMNRTGFGLQNLDEKATTKVADVILPLKPPDLQQQFDFSKVNAEGSGVPSRKHLSSLKPYSMVVTDQNIAKETDFKNQLTLLHKDHNLMHVYPTEVDIKYLMSKKHDLSKIPSNLLGKNEKMARVHSSHTLGSNAHLKVIGHSAINGKVNGPSSPRETMDDDIELPVHKNEEKHSPSVINNKVGPGLRVCKIISERDDDEKSLKRVSVTKKRKHKSRCSTKVARCSDGTAITLHAPPCSSFHSIPLDNQSLPNKRVRFSEAKLNNNVNESGGNLRFGYGSHGACYKTSERVKESSLCRKPESRKKRINYLTSSSTPNQKEMLFNGLVFLLTGFSSRKEKELEALIRKHGGFVFSTIPSYWPEVRGKRRVQCMSMKLPIILSPEKVQSTKFLFGCAINAWMLSVNWLFDSLHANAVLSPGKYMTRLIQPSERNCVRIGQPLCLNSAAHIFDRLGIMPYGKTSFCTKFSKIIKYGGGQLFKSLQKLVQSLKIGKISVGAILVEDEGSVPRHLNHCALEHDLQAMPASWIINSLFSGKLVPVKKDRCALLHRIKMPSFPQAEALDMSEEI